MIQDHTRDLTAAAQAAPRHRPLATLVENVSESGLACLVTMVQGNLFAMTLGHWIIASRTGLVAGTVAAAALLLAGAKRRWVAASLLAVVTFGVDIFSHPAQFGGVATEAIVTGMAAGALSLLVGKGIAIRRSRSALGRVDATVRVVDRSG
jgi:hypothetical protein